MLRTRQPSASTSQHLTPGKVHEYMEPDTPIGHYDSRTHVHAKATDEVEGNLSDIDIQDSHGSSGRTTSREMNGGQQNLAGRRGEKGLFLDGLSRLQALGSGGKGKGKAQYRLGMSRSLKNSIIGS